jgi:hypothetical protein
MIGQQLRAADATFPVINRTFTQPRTPCKAFSTILSACHPPESCPTIASIRPGAGGVSHLQTIQRLPGHSDIKTTMIYLQTVPSVTLKEAKSPLDCL